MRQRRTLQLERSWRPWLSVRAEAKALVAEPALLLIDGDYQRSEARLLTADQEVVIFTLRGQGPGAKAIPLPFRLLIRLARLSPQSLIYCDNGGSYRCLRLDADLVLAVAAEQMVIVSGAAMPLKRALDLAAEHLVPEPQPQPVS
jgi:hypothetical protein